MNSSPGGHFAKTKNAERKNALLGDLMLKPLPVFSLVAILLPALILMLMSLSPSILSVLQRDRVALAAGQWWRILSPLLVDSDGWFHWVYVSVGFVCVGIVAEHFLGRWRWLLLFFSGALAGELAGYLWQPYGGGTSIALFGVMGGLIVLLLKRGSALFLITALYAGTAVVVLVVEAVASALHLEALMGIILALVLCWLVGMILTQLIKRDVPPRTLCLFLLGIDLVGALILTLLHDNHGPSLLAGMAVGALLAWLDPKFCQTKQLEDAIMDIKKSG